MEGLKIEGPEKGLDNKVPDKMTKYWNDLVKMACAR